MQLFFIAFKLFKPYLLILYNDVHWAIQLMNYMSQTCLKKDISLLKQKSPSISYEDSIEHIITFNIPIRNYLVPPKLALFPTMWVYVHCWQPMTISFISKPNFKWILWVPMDWYMWCWICNIITKWTILTKKIALLMCEFVPHKNMGFFFNKKVFCENDILGCVKQHVCQYEVQHTLTLYCHIII